MRAFVYTGGAVFPEGITERPQDGDLVIAADSGYLNARKLGVNPSVLLGNFDSLGEPSAPPGLTNFFAFTMARSPSFTAD